MYSLAIMTSKPTLILVPGAWHSPSTWVKVATLLEQQDFKCVPVTLPSTTGNVSATLGDDVKAVRDAIQGETSKGRDVVVVAHSYGGAVGQSAIKGLTRPKIGHADPLPPTGHVIGLAMIASGFGQTGTSFIDGVGGSPPPSWRTDPSGFAVIVAPPRELFYHDLPVEEGDYWVSKLEKQALKALMEGGEFSYAGWRDVPVWLLATTEDKALPVQVVYMMVEMAKKEGADVTLREVASSHSPMLSKPKETEEFILEAVAAFVGSK